MEAWMSDLLPPNANLQEHALDDALARLGTIPVEIVKTWNAQTCPADLLTWLAWALSIDEWDSNWSVAQQRAMIAASYEIHRHKGTPYSIKLALIALGYDNVHIIEGEWQFHNGVITHDGTCKHGGDSVWPLFDVILNIFETPSAGMITKIRDRINRYKNARSHLRNLIFTNLFHNGEILHDGTYKHNGGVL
jgi:phage tail P2-like protein